MAKNKLIKNQKGFTGLIMVIATIISLFVIGFAIDIFRVRVDQQELSRLTDITALALATESSQNACVITQSQFDQVVIKIWEKNAPNETYQVNLYSSPEDMANGIVRVSGTSVTSLFYTSAFLSNTKGGLKIIMNSEAKCTHTTK
jgi:Flp pilus assembly protein TadG